MRQLYLDLPEMNWFTVTYFGDYALPIPVFLSQLYGK